MYTYSIADRCVGGISICSKPFIYKNIHQLNILYMNVITFLSDTTVHVSMVLEMRSRSDLRSRVEQSN